MKTLLIIILFSLSLNSIAQQPIEIKPKKDWTMVQYHISNAYYYSTLIFAGYEIGSATMQTKNPKLSIHKVEIGLISVAIMVSVKIPLDVKFKKKTRLSLLID